MSMLRYKHIDDTKRMSWLQSNFLNFYYSFEVTFMISWFFLLKSVYILDVSYVANYHFTLPVGIEQLAVT